MRYPVSYAQQRIWEQGAATAHVSYACRLDGDLDVAALQRAMDVLVARHAALRTGITGQPEQVVTDTVRLSIDHMVRTDGAEQLAADLAERPFDLTHGPLLRVAAIETGQGRWLFVLVAHRMIADDASLAILLDELSTVYSGGTATLPELWMDYGDYAVWQRERWSGPELTRQLDWWREPLRDAPPDLTLPPGPPGRTTASIDPIADSAVFAGYAIVLAQYAQQRDVVIGVPVSGRIRTELAPIVGPFADTVPVRISLTGTFAQLSHQVREASAAARSHDELPQNLLNAGRTARFNSARPPAPALRLPGMVTRDRLTMPPTVACDLDLTVDDGTLSLDHRVDPSLADEFLRALVTVLKHAGQAPDTPVAELLALVQPSPHAVGTAPPGDPVEATMARIWADLLHTTDPIGVHDNLFARGAGSLAAMRFAAQIADTYGVYLPLHRIVATPTIAALAEIVSAELPSTEADAELAAMSDADLNDLLRAVLAARDRRAGKGDRP